MAKQRFGVNDAYRGTVGTVIGYEWRGKWCLRARPLHVRNPRTAKQQSNRQLFKQMVDLASHMKFALRKGLRGMSLGMHVTECNLFVKRNKECFSLDAEGRMVVDWERLIVSEGEVAAPGFTGTALMDTVLMDTALKDTPLSQPQAAASSPSLGEQSDRCFAREREYPQEEEQKEARKLVVKRDVPSKAVYLAWPMCDHWGDGFRACDLVSDVLSTGSSSRVYNAVVRPGRLVSEADAYISGEAGPGLMVMSAKVLPDASVDEVADALRHEAYLLADKVLSQHELEKVQNRYESTFVYSQYKAADRALSLCHYTWLGDTAMVNREPEEYRKVTTEELQRVAREVFRPEHENMLVYEKID